jgi:hypothetical protein
MGPVSSAARVITAWLALPVMENDHLRGQRRMALGTGLTGTQVRVNFRHPRRRPASWEFPLGEGPTEEVPPAMAKRSGRTGQ